MSSVSEGGVDGGLLRFVERVECRLCGSGFEGEFVREVGAVGAPVGVHKCPLCRFEFASEMPGWVVSGEAR